MLNVMLLGGGTFGRGLSHESSALTKGISDLMKEAPESSLISSTMIQLEGTSHEQGRWSSLECNRGGTLILDFLGCRTVRNKIHQDWLFD